MQEASLDSFKCRRTLEAGGKAYAYYDLKLAEKNGLAGISRAALLAQGSAGKSAAPRGRAHRHPRGHRGDGGMAGEPRQGRPRDRLSPRPRADAGFHRRAGRRRSRRHARCHEARWAAIPQKINPLAPRRSRHRPFGDGRLLRHAARPSSRMSTLEYERNGERYTFLQMGPEAPSTISASCRPAPASATRSISNISPSTVWTARKLSRRHRGRGRLSRHAGRHRQPHHHGQRPGRARLGRRRHRGRSGHARPADLDADPGGHRLQAHRQATRGHHRDRSRAHRHPDAAQEGRRRQIRRVLRRRPAAHVARGSRHDRQYGARNMARPAASSRSTPKRCDISRAPAAPPTRIALVEAYAKAQGMFRTKDTPDPVFTDTLELDLATVEPSLAGPKRPAGPRGARQRPQPASPRRMDERVQARRDERRQALPGRGQRLRPSAMATW